MTLFSIQDFCQAMAQNVANRPTESLSSAAKSFLQDLDLPRLHPFCSEGFNFTLVDIPPMGSLLQDLHESRFEAFITYLYMHIPALLAFADLWFRLLAGFLAPIGIAVLIWWNVHVNARERAHKHQQFTPKGLFSVTMISTVACALVLMTDSMYILEYEPPYGVALFVASLLLSLRLTFRYKICRVRWMLAALVALAISLCFHRGHVHFGNPDDVDIRFPEGLYFNSNNTLVRRLVEAWPKDMYTYSNPTPWMMTGDVRTGLPFVLYSQSLNELQSTRVFLNVSDGECLALDIYFPSNDKAAKATENPGVLHPLYLVLHGINGGSNEEYVKDLVQRATRRGSIVVVMVSRGLMDLPIRGWNIFHAARLTDVHEAATYLKKHVVRDNQVLAGVGYSMGAIVLNNYAVSYGRQCALDAAFSISGAMDCRHEAFNERAKRLWLPMVADLTRFSQLTTKWANRLAQRLQRDDMIALLRSKNVVEADQYSAVVYNGYRDLMHYYSESGALGDVPWEHRESPIEFFKKKHRKITKLNIPLCVLQAFDDPISTFRTIVGNSGFMNPESLVRLGAGNLLVLLTKRGGHVGWPEGWRPWQHKWRFMSEAAITFVEAMAEARKATRRKRVIGKLLGTKAATQ